MKIEFEVKTITIIQGTYRDCIVLTITGTTPVPGLPKDYPHIDPQIEIGTKGGFALQWLNENGIKCRIEDVRLIDGRNWK